MSKRQPKKPNQKKQAQSIRMEELAPKAPAKPKSPLQAKTAAQKSFISSLRHNKITFGIGPAGVGKAQPLDSLVKTPEGWSKMGDLKPGSEVIAADGSVTRVVTVHPQGRKEIFKIKFADGRSAECCDDHLWRVHRYDWAPSETRWRVIPLSEISNLLNKPSCKNRLSIQLSSHQIEPDRNLPLDPYSMGVLIGDGHFGKDCVRLSTEDDFILNEVKNALPATSKLRHIKGPDYAIIGDVDNVQNNEVLNELRGMGMCGLKSATKFIPDIYLNSSEKQKIALIQGLMDADGTITSETGSMSFCTVSEKLAVQFQNLIRSIGGLAKVKEKETGYIYKGEKRTGQKAYNVSVRVRDPRTMFRLPRKLSKAPNSYQYAKSLRLGITSIESIGFKEAQCISIEHPDHLYVTNDYVVTHNTYVSARVASHMLLNKEIEKIYLTRPAVESGRPIGFLKGTMEEKMAPYIAAYGQGFRDGLGQGHFEYLMRTEQIEIVPLNFMQGRSFDELSMVLFDEAQNSTVEEMKMFLTRLGEGARYCIDGDPQQCMLGSHVKSGLIDGYERICYLDTVDSVIFTRDDIVRHGLVRLILDAYDTETNSADSRETEISELPSFISG